MEGFHLYNIVNNVIPAKAKTMVKQDLLGTSINSVNVKYFMQSDISK